MIRIILISFLITTSLFSFENISEDKIETNTHKIHSYGVLSYGLHSNTFHLRNAFLRYNLTPFSEKVQFFFTVKGYRDTHIPETNYSSLLNNLELYDYGVNVWLYNVFLSLRGAANYQQNTDSLLLFIPYKIQNDTEFDSPDIYKNLFPSYAGIRFGFDFSNFIIAYSQGDYRHMIPSGVFAKFLMEDFYIRWVSLFYHNNPLVYEADNLYFVHQLSARKDFTFYEFVFSGIFDITYYTDNDVILRFEEGITYSKITLGLRELYNFKDNKFIFEASIKRNFADIFNIGLQIGTDGRFYIATEIDF
ncbi:MAG: hypothetical protein N2258_03080 [Brevinematales bacterium]|nr:hypothetical protein [Brevinematales bacterium]